MPQLRVERLRAELEFVTKEFEAGNGRWNQEVWFSQNSECGTTGCLATWTVVHSGCEPKKSIFMDQCMTPQGRTVCIEEEAEHQLGLTPIQTRALFMSSNTIEDLWMIANIISGGEIKIPEEVRYYPGTEDRHREEWHDYLTNENMIQQINSTRVECCYPLPENTDRKI